MDIRITGPVVVQLQNIRNKLEKDLMGRPTWSMVIALLIKAYNENKRLKSLLKSKDEELKRKTDEYLRLSLQRPSTPLMAVQQNASVPSPPPPPSQLSAPPKPLPPKKIDIKPSANVKADFMRELKEAVGVANGGDFLKPSQVAKATGVKYKEVIIDANEA